MLMRILLLVVGYVICVMVLGHALCNGKLRSHPELFIVADKMEEKPCPFSR